MQNGVAYRVDMTVLTFGQLIERVHINGEYWLPHALVIESAKFQIAAEKVIVSVAQGEVNLTLTGFSGGLDEQGEIIFGRGGIVAESFVAVEGFSGNNDRKVAGGYPAGVFLLYRHGIDGCVVRALQEY